MENKDPSNNLVAESSIGESSFPEEARNAAKVVDMARAYRIRGRMIPILGILTSLLFCLFVSMWYQAVSGEINAVTALVSGALISFFAIPLHLLGGFQAIRAERFRSLFYVMGILINSLGASLCMTAYYIHLGEKPSNSAVLAAVVVTAGLYALVCLFIQILPDRYGLFTGLAALIVLGLIIACVVFWIKSDSKALFSFGFFNLVWTLITVIALHVACSDEESPWLRFSSFASFGILIAVAAVVLLVLVCAGGDGCDCDCGDGCGECCDCGVFIGETGSTQKRTARKRRRS